MNHYTKKAFIFINIKFSDFLEKDNYVGTEIPGLWYSQYMFSAYIHTTVLYSQTPKHWTPLGQDTMFGLEGVQV